MDSTLDAVLASWNWRPDVLLVVLSLGGVYVAGWRRLRRRGYRRLARWWRLASYLTGLASVAAALLSPIDRLASVLFTVHMIQHLLLMMAAAPLLLLANPLPVCLWGLPRQARRVAGGLLTRNAAFRKMLWTLTLMPVAWFLYVGNLWMWHIPAAYEAALRDGMVHDLEHLTFFGTALLFWWPIIEPAPRLHRPLHPAFGILYLLAATGQNTLLGAVIALPEQLRYPFYAGAPRLFGLSALDDQALAGGIMWSGGHMYLIPILLVVARALDNEQRKTRRLEAIPRERG